MVFWQPVPARRRAGVALRWARLWLGRLILIAIVAAALAYSARPFNLGVLS